MTRSAKQTPKIIRLRIFASDVSWPRLGCASGMLLPSVINNHVIPSAARNLAVILSSSKPHVRLELRSSSAQSEIPRCARNDKRSNLTAPGG